MKDTLEVVSSQLHIYQDFPLNAGSPSNHKRQSLITPQVYFFVRNHGSIPDVDVTSYRLRILRQEQLLLELSLDELKNNFPSSSVVATLQCAGYRRKELIDHQPVPDEIPWGADAISTAEWRGVPLREVLQKVGVDEETRHVAFLGLDTVYKENENVQFGASICIAKAINPEVLLAYEMNGEPLTPVHGFPLRLVVPGYIGARSVKWLESITLQQEPSDNYFQSRSYKLFPPHVQTHNAHLEQAPTIEHLPLNSVISYPTEGETLREGETIVRGYALTGNGNRIVRVELSTNEGKTWTQATLFQPQEAWAWCFWKQTLFLTSGSRQLIVRAWDTTSAAQPQSVCETWNWKGYLNNAWHRVHITVE